MTGSMPKRSRHGSAPSGISKRQRRTLSKKSILRRKPTAATQRRQILALSSKVNKVAKRVAENRVKATFKLKNSDPIDIKKSLDASLANHYYTVVDFTPLFPSNLDLIYKDSMGAEQTIEEGHTLKFKHFGFQWSMTAGSDRHSDMLIVLMHAKSQKVFDETAKMTTFTENVDYTRRGAMFSINTDRFKVHYARRVRTASNGAGGSDNLQIPIKPFSGYYSRSLNWKIKSKTGYWMNVLADQMPAFMKQKLVIFNDNGPAESNQPYFSYPQLELLGLWRAERLGA